MLDVYVGPPHHLVATNGKPFCVANARTRVGHDRMNDIGGFYVSHGQNEPALRETEQWDDVHALDDELCKRCRKRMARPNVRRQGSRWLVTRN